MHAKPYILLGRTGDLIIVAPALQRIFHQTGKKPMVVVSRQYCGVLDGMSYVQSVPVAANWWLGWPAVSAFIKREFGGYIALQGFAAELGHDITQSVNFEHGMFLRAGFTLDDLKTFPLEFDRRSAVRERKLLAKHVAGDKPLLLVHLGGISSPFPHTTKVWQLINRYQPRFQILNLDSVKAFRIYDMLGIMERATGMVLCDSAPLHLAAATETPVFAFTVGGWRGSLLRVPRGTCVTYAEALNSLDRLKEFLEGLSSDSARLQPLRAERRSDSPTQRRSVDVLAVSGLVRPADPRQCAPSPLCRR